LWNIADPTKPRPLPATLTSNATVLAFSPVGHTLATGSADNTVQLWNVTNPSHPAPAGPPLSGHTGIVNAMAFTANGQTLATASSDGSVRLWNVTDPTHPAALAVLGRENSMIQFYSVAVSPDGHLLAATGLSFLNESVIAETWLWKIDPGRAAAADVCAAAGSASKPITQAQWQQYFPGQAFSPPCPAT
jgi:WD40 repeat protein